MKNLKLALFVCISSIGLLFFNSCNQDSLTENSILKENSTDISTFQRSVNENPLDYVGIAHNEYMKEFTKNLENSFNQGKWENISFLSSEFKTNFSQISNEAFIKLFPNSDSDTNKQEVIYNELDINEWFDNDSTNELMLAESILNSKATQKDKEYTMNLLTDVYNAVNNATSDEIAYNELDKIIIKHENLILSQGWSSNEDNALGALAIAKYSAEFWKSYDFSKFNQGNTNLAGRRNPRSSVIVGADVAGYVIGGVVGGVAGVAVGPVTLGAGTVAGVLGGKAVGAWTGSAAAATAITIYDAWSDWF